MKRKSKKARPKDPCVGWEAPDRLFLTHDKCFWAEFLDTIASDRRRVMQGILFPVFDEEYSIVFMVAWATPPPVKQVKTWDTLVRKWRVSCDRADA